MSGTKTPDGDRVTSETARACHLVVVGTVALDDVATPAGEAKGVLGGSATYFGVAASLFTRVGLVGVVGRRLPRRVPRGARGARHRPRGPRHRPRRGGRSIGRAATTPRWRARPRSRRDLNVLAHVRARAAAGGTAAARYVFLANTAPAIQLRRPLRSSLAGRRGSSSPTR